MAFFKYIGLFFVMMSFGVLQNDLDNDFNFKENVHVTAQISNSNPKINQTITIVYKLYVSYDVGISSWEELKTPEFLDFENKNITPETVKIEYGKYKGKAYRYVLLKEVELKPKHSGEFKIEPLELKITAEFPSDEKDVFGNRTMKKETQTLATEPLVINVKQ